MTSATRKNNPAWATCGQTHDSPAVIPHPSAGSVEAASVGQTDEAPVARCLTKRALCQWLGVSTRTWDRATAERLTPAPDLIVGRSPRWSPATIERWLRTHPRLPGRGRQ
jgi:hypothetical protein